MPNTIYQHSDDAYKNTYRVYFEEGKYRTRDSCNAISEADVITDEPGCENQKQFKHRSVDVYDENDRMENSRRLDLAKGKCGGQMKKQRKRYDGCSIENCNFKIRNDVPV